MLIHAQQREVLALGALLVIARFLHQPKYPKFYHDILSVSEKCVANYSLMSESPTTALTFKKALG